MRENELIIEKNDYEMLKRIESHAKEYEIATDKKEFLRNVSAYEQKIILLQSKNPYEVLNYLDELDLKKSRVILNSLQYEEVKQILDLFSSEDKKEFYASFSDLNLVNKFIIYDKNVGEYINDLTFDRKVDLIGASNSQTVFATSKVYESMPYYQRDKVSDLVTNSNAVSVFSKTYTDQYDSEVSDLIENNEINPLDIKDEKADEKLVEKIEEEIKEEDETEQNNELSDNQINEFFKSRLEYYINNIPEFAKLSVNEQMDYSLLPDELKMIIGEDFQLANQNKIKPEKVENTKIDTDSNFIGLTEEEKSIIENDTVELFQKAKQNCEQVEIIKITNAIQNELTLKKIEIVSDEVIPKKM